MGQQGPLAGKGALITGASRGIGAAIVRRLATQGAAVAIGYKQRQQEATDLVDCIKAAGGEGVAFAADLTIAEECALLVQKSQERLGKVDILVHNAGLPAYGLVFDTTIEQWDELHHLHMRAGFLLAKAALPRMIQEGWGRVIVVSSVWGMVGAANEVAYSAMKAGQIGFVRALAKEVARTGVTVNSVAPGAVETEMLSCHLEAEELADFAEQVPVGRLGKPEEVAAAVAFLSSVESGYITGQVLSPNGALVV